MTAFNRLILEGEYTSVTPRGVAAAADVGRSTFYEHFRGVEDLLAQSLAAVFAPLTSAFSETEPTDAALRAVRHVWENRRLARVLFSGASYRIALRSLAGQFEAALKTNMAASRTNPILALDLIALQLAAAQLALLNAWTSGRSHHSAPEITRALHAGCRASALALLGTPTDDGARSHR